MADARQAGASLLAKTLAIVVAATVLLVTVICLPLRTAMLERFAAIEVLGKGPRFTITPSGLRACGQIVVMALGAAKASALARELSGPDDVETTPSQILKTYASRVIWLVDAAAAAQL